MDTNFFSKADGGDLDCRESLERVWSMNKTVTPSTRQCVHTSILLRAAEYPEKTAVDAWDGNWSYAKLDEVSTQLALSLIELGVGPETIVPICSEKSRWVPVAVLGVLKAGGAFTLLDTSQPEARLHAVVRQCHATVICSSFTHQDLSARLAPNTILLAYEGENLSFKTTGTGMLPTVDPGWPMYVCFTSGSTGLPKGIVIPHSSMSTALQHQMKFLGIDRESRTFDFASYSFDVAVHNIFATLVMGACLCIPSDMDRKYCLAETICATKATVVNLTASVARLIEPEIVPNLKTLLFLGEAVNPSDIERWWGKVQVINTYGPAECTPISTINLKGTTPCEASRIGKGIGVVTWIVDPENHEYLTPYGEIGELLLEGSILATGYLHDPEKTSAAFIQDPGWLLRGAAGFPGRHGRLYKTGDLVKYDDDGELSFVGRKDTQVKIRGQRVELGEVEYHIKKAIAAVKQVVAQTVEVGNEKEKALLVAFLEYDESYQSPNEGVTISHSGSRKGSNSSSANTRLDISLGSSQHLSSDTSFFTNSDRRKTGSNMVDINSNSMRHPEPWNIAAGLTLAEVPDPEASEISSRLPTYMIPTVYLRIPKIPLTPSGKADRKLLREVGASLLNQIAPLQPDHSEQMDSRADTERVPSLRELWALALSVPAESIGLECNFFRLGGDSISVIKLVGAARKHGLALSARHIFEHPTLAAQADVLANTDQQEAKHIAPFSLISGVEGTEGVQRLRRELSILGHIDGPLIQDAYPCTPLQEGLLALASKRRGDYVLQLVLELSNDVDLKKFRHAWEATVESLPVLRTRIVQHERHDFVQVVSEQQANLYETTGQLEDYLQEDKLRPMELGDSLSRAALVEDGSSNHQRWFVWTVHHALMDGWSVRLVLDLFNTIESQRHNGLHAPPSFNCFVEYLAETRQDDYQSYWQSYLGNGVSEIFPALSPTQEVKADATLEYQQLLPKRTVGLTENNEATVSTLVRAALAIMIRSQTGQNDVAFGTTLSGRNVPMASVDSIIGPTIATVPVRVEMHDGQTIPDLLSQIQSQALEMIPFEQTGLRRIAKIDGNTQAACNFQTLVVVQPPNAEMPIESPYGTWQPSHAQKSLSTYAMTLECFVANEGVKIRASFDSAIVPEWRMEGMLHQLGTLLEQISTASADQTIGDINHFTTHDRNLVWKWNKLLPPAVDRSVPDLIREQAHSHPGAPALCGDGRQTYSDLETMSSRLAHHLVSCGIGEGDIVPLFFEKSIWTIVAMLAVLKAGAAFATLDPVQAPERRSLILKKIRARLALTSSTYARTSLGLDCSSIEVGPSCILSLPEPDQQSSLPLVSSNSAAYIIFTSGTTGEPKGVIVEHSAIATSSYSYGPAMGISASSRVLQFASYTFDASILEIITTLLLGGCVCVPSETERTTNISGVIDSMSVNFALLTPTVARMIQPNDVPTLSTLVLGGEAVAKSDYDQWGDLANLLNAYGPTECAVVSVLSRFEKNVTLVRNIGRPTGCVGWVVEPGNDSKLAPVGAIGELLLEGPILARGYLDDVEKTRTAFIKNPPWLLPERNGRLYKTGDLVRQNHDGSFSFIRRKDTQVKIGGQRVELGEIEFNLRECIPTATQVVAEVIKPSGIDTGILVAFVELMDHGDLEASQFLELSRVSPELGIVQTPASLSEKLYERLPAHMVPRVFFRVGRIPLLVSGKTDRRRLHELSSVLTAQQIANAQSTETTKKRQPVSVLEERLSSLWAEVLGIKASTIGLDDSFFRLGGDSVAAMKLVAIARRNSMSLSVADVFLHPTLGAQAGVVDTNSIKEAEAVLPFQLLTDGTPEEVEELQSELSECYGIDTSLIEDAYPCTPLQEGLMSLTAKKDGNYTLQMVLEFSESIDLDVLRATWEVLSEKLAILRTRIVQHSNYGLLQVVSQENIPWAVYPECNIEDFLEADNAMPMDLTQILSRLTLVNNKSNRPGWLVWTVHHALYDGWSLPLVLGLLDDIYSEASVGPQPGFNNFISYLGQIEALDPKAYWTSYLADCQSTPIVAINASVDEPLADTTVDYEQLLPSTWTERQTEATLSTLVRAALALLISSYTGSEDVVFGATVSGRHAPVPRIEDIAGPTIATVPVRVKVQKNDNILDYVKNVQDGAMEMVPYEQMGLHRIAKLNESAKDACDFQILLVIQPKEDKTRDHKVGRWRLVSSQQKFSTYPLTLECVLEENGIRLKGIFDSRATEKWKVETMLSKMGSIVEQLANAGTSGTLNDIDLMKHDTCVIKEWNKSIPEVSDECIHELIEARMHQQPNSPAVCSWDGDLTYAELDVYSANLAVRLSGFVQQGKFVPLCFEKSMWTVVAMLAVLRAGGAFVLLDPGLPEKRLQLICQKVHAVVALTSVASRNRLTKFVPNVLEVGPKTSQLDPLELQPARVSPRDAAYIIFTSGSTGTPKGCIIEHRAYCTATLSHGSDLMFGTSTRTLGIGSYLFAGSLTEILITLIHGGCVCVLSDEQRTGEQLAPAIRKLKANWTFMTSSLLSYLKPEDVPTLRTICVGGEPIRSSQIKQWAPHVELRQTYGSAETSTFVSLAQLKESAAPTEVGRAITGRFWIVNPENVNQLMPIGAIGELLIEGWAIGQCYLDEPEKTAAAFIPAPAWTAKFHSDSANDMAPFYRTGDLAAYKSDGSIELLGRKDMQVKLQGQRIELGEVEHQIIISTTDVAKVAVEIAPPNTSEGRTKQTLIAFIVWKTTQEGHPQVSVASQSHREQTSSALANIRSSLEKSLPYFMVPALFMPLPDLPYTASRKLDRRRLREIGLNLTAQQMADFQRDMGGEKRAPHTQKQEDLRRLWAQVLDLDESMIGLDDSFFQLGGDSVSAMKLVGAARQTSISLTVADIFRQPILIAQAETLTSSLPTPINGSIAPFSLVAKSGSPRQIRRELSMICGVDSTLIADAYPCTPLQEGLLSLTARRTGDYTLQHVLEISHDVTDESLQSAWQAVVDQVPILRTRIVQTSRGMLQVVCKEAIEWTRVEDLDEYLAKDKTNPMIIGKRLCRFALVVDGFGKPTQLVMTIHHALYDAQSLSHTLGLADMAYRGKALPESTPFVSLVKHVIETKDSDIFWQSYLKGYSGQPFPSLPRNVEKTSVNCVLEHSQAFATSGKSLRMSSNATRSTFVRTALGIVIGRYTASTDVVFGTISSGRSSAISGIKDMVGPTIATVPFRVRVPPPQTCISEYMGKMQSEATEAISYEQTGLQNIVRFDESTKRACDFQTLLVIQSEDKEFQPDKRPLGKWWSVANEEGFATYGLNLECTFDDKGDFHARASFDSRVLSEWVAGRLLKHLGAVLESLLTAQPGQTFDVTNTLLSEELSMIWEWNKVVPEPIDRHIVDMIQDQVCQQAAAPAIRSWDGGLTYNELDFLSSRLAYHLASIGIGPDDIVPLCFEKSMWVIVAMLGVLKAGSAFVCLEPGDQGTARWHQVLEEISARVVLTSANSSGITVPQDCLSIAIEPEFLLSLEKFSQHTRPLGMQKSSMAYATYTSSGADEPRAVVVDIEALSTSSYYNAQHLGLGTTSRVLQSSSYTHDVCITEIFPTLAFGGCVCIPHEDSVPGNLAYAMSTLNANTAVLTPTVARMIKPQDALALKTLILTGEPAAQSDREIWSSAVTLIETYSPVGCAGHATISFVTADVGEKSMGRPSGCTTWIVDPTNYEQLSPMGAVGELLIEGPTLGRSYIHDREMSTAEFPRDLAWLSKGNPPSGQEGRCGTLYRTGELVRYAEDGSIIHLGRKGATTKLRGQQVKLAEVECCVQLCVQAAEQVAAEVIAPAGDDLGELLAVFVKVKAGARQTPDDARLSLTQPSLLPDGFNILPVSSNETETISRQLPAYMMPELYIEMSEVPLLTSGTVNRERLQRVFSGLSAEQLANLMTKSKAATSKQSPVTDTERRLCTLWSDVLNIDEDSIGLGDTFLSLGGDSIGAMKLAAAARQAGINLTVTEIFKHASLADIAAHTDRQVSKSQTVPAPQPFSLLDRSTRDAVVQSLLFQTSDIGPDDIGDVLPVTSFQEDNLQQSLIWPRQSFNYFFLDFNHDLDVTRMEESIHALLRQFAILRSIFIGSKGRYWQVVLKRLVMPLQIIDVEGSVVAAAHAACVRETEHSFFRPGQPTTSFTLIRSAGVGYRMIIRLSHATYDGISLPIIIATLSDFYQRKPLPPPMDFSLFLNCAIQQEKSSIEYWRQVLDGSRITKVTDLFSSGVAETGALLHAPQKILVEDMISTFQLPENITLNSLVNSACAMVLSALTGEKDVVFGGLVNGRNSNLATIDRIVGPCLNVVPIRAQMSRFRTPYELMQSVQGQFHQMGSADSLSLDKIVKHSTNWAAGSNFDFFLQHQNIDEEPEFDHEGGTMKANSFYNPFFVPTSLGMLSFPHRDGVKLQILANTHIVTPAAADALLDSICSTIVSLLAHSDSPLSTCVPDILRIGL